MSVALKRPPTPAMSLKTSEDMPYGRPRVFLPAVHGRMFLPLLEAAGPSNSSILCRSYRMPLNGIGAGSRRTDPPDAAGSIPEGPRQGEWRGLLGYVERWERLADDWDGEGGRPPSAGVVAGVRGMIERLKAARTSVPFIYVVGDGEIGLRWEKGAAYASASFVDDGDLLLYLHEGDRVLHDRDEEWTADADLDAFIRDVVRLG